MPKLTDLASYNSPEDDAAIISRLNVDDAIEAGLNGTCDDNMMGDAAYRLALEVVRLRELEASR